jgi:hypothetical protein
VRFTGAAGDASLMLLSERRAEWMALLALCPRRLRDQYARAYNGDPAEDEAISHALRIPRIMIKVVMGDYYWRALEALTGELPAPIVKKGHPS